MKNYARLFSCLLLFVVACERPETADPTIDKTILAITTSREEWVEELRYAATEKEDFVTALLRSSNVLNDQLSRTTKLGVSDPVSVVKLQVRGNLLQLYTFQRMAERERKAGKLIEADATFNHVNRLNREWRASLVEKASTDRMFTASWKNLKEATRHWKLPEPGTMDSP
jgi:hypothetical protein